jgi:isoleucyl-tRNA synthetase
VTVAKLLAPFTPFIADEIYDNLSGELPSVHLSDFPQPAPRDEELEFAMATARETVRLGLAARTGAKIKLRQPLHEAVIVAGPRERAAIERLADVVRDELNVKQLRFVVAADELGQYQVKANYRTLGPRLGKNMPALVAALGTLDPAHVAQTLARAETVNISLEGHEYQLSSDDVLLSLAPLDGYSLEREGSHAVALELGITDELRAEGVAREIVHAVQDQRKKAGLAVEDRIILALGGERDALAAAEAHADYIARETLTVSLTFDASDGERASVEGMTLIVSLQRA